MASTFNELTLVELLELNSTEIVEAFKDKIENEYSSVYYRLMGGDVDEEEECYE